MAQQLRILHCHCRVSGSAIGLEVPHAMGGKKKKKKKKKNNSKGSGCYKWFFLKEKNRK